MLSHMKPNKKPHTSHMQNGSQTSSNRMPIEIVEQLDNEILKMMIPPERVVNMAGVSRRFRERILRENMDTDIVKVDKSKPPHTIFTSLTTVVQRYPVKRLDLSGLKITDELMPLFTNVIANCRSLTHLNLARCRIRGQSFMALDSMWANCQFLQHVDLNQNNIGPEGAPSVGTLLQTCPSLLHLNLNDNKIGDEGIAAIAIGLCRGKWAGDYSPIETRMSSKLPLLQLHLDGNSLSKSRSGRCIGIIMSLSLIHI